MRRQADPSGRTTLPDRIEPRRRAARVALLRAIELPLGIAFLALQVLRKDPSGGGQTSCYGLTQRALGATRCPGALPGSGELQPQLRAGLQLRSRTARVDSS